MTIYESECFYVRIHIVTCTFIIEIARIVLDFTTKKNLYTGSVFCILQKHMISWFSMYGAPHGSGL